MKHGKTSEKKANHSSHSYRHRQHWSSRTERKANAIPHRHHRRTGGSLHRSVHRHPTRLSRPSILHTIPPLLHSRLHCRCPCRILAVCRRSSCSSIWNTTRWRLIRHSFVQRKHASAHAAAHADPFNTSALASALSPSAAPHSVLSMDADLAGTTAGAYLILPTASFQPRDFSGPDSDGQWYSPPQPPVSSLPDPMRARPAHFSSQLSYDDVSHHHHRMRPTTLDQMRRDTQPQSALRPGHLASATDAYYRDDLDEQENPTFTNTRHVMVDAIQDVALTITPEFVASLDHFTPLLQSAHASIEDTLDELHLQFSRVFSSDAGEELAMALAREKPFTARSHLAVSVPSVSMELLQSATFAGDGMGASSSLVYSTILCVDALLLKQTVDYPLPEGFGSADSASSFPSLIDLATPLNVRQPDLPPQLPSTERTLSFTRLHVFSSLLNPHSPPAVSQLGTAAVPAGRHWSGAVCDRRAGE